MTALLWKLLLYAQPKRFRDIGTNSELLGLLQSPLLEVAEALHQIAEPVMSSARTLSGVTSSERERLYAVLSGIAGKPVSEKSFTKEAQSVIEMLASLKDGFVPTERSHQYGSDGSSNQTDAFVLLLTAFYPDFDFGESHVIRLDSHEKILNRRSWFATLSLILSAWLAGHATDDLQQESDVQVVRTFLEGSGILFKAPPGHIQEQMFSVKYNPSQGCEFVGYEESSAHHVHVSWLMPRFVCVPIEGVDHYYPTYLEFRDSKDAASRIRKSLVGRKVGDEIAFRLFVRSAREWQAIRPKLEGVLCGEARGATPEIVDGVRVNGSPNEVSVHNEGVLWKGGVRIPGVSGSSVELQFLLHSTYWNRVHALGRESDAFYKINQWCRAPEHRRGEVDGPMVAPIQLIFPVALFPEWESRVFLAEVLKMRLLQKAAKLCLTDPQVYLYIDRVVEEFLRGSLR